MLMIIAVPAVARQVADLRLSAAWIAQLRVVTSAVIVHFRSNRFQKE